MQIWRMKPDGSDQEQITTDEYNDWFAHPSPDGKWIVYSSMRDAYERELSEEEKAALRGLGYIH